MARDYLEHTDRDHKYQLEQIDRAIRALHTEGLGKVFEEGRWGEFQALYEAKFTQLELLAESGFEGVSLESVTANIADVASYITREANPQLRRWEDRSNDFVGLGDHSRKGHERILKLSNRARIIVESLKTCLRSRIEEGVAQEAIVELVPVEMGLRDNSLGRRQWNEQVDTDLRDPVHPIKELQEFLSVFGNSNKIVLDNEEGRALRGYVNASAQAFLDRWEVAQRTLDPEQVPPALVENAVAMCDLAVAEIKAYREKVGEEFAADVEWTTRTIWHVDKYKSYLLDVLQKEATGEMTLSAGRYMEVLYAQGIPENWGIENVREQGNHLLKDAKKRMAEALLAIGRTDETGMFSDIEINWENIEDDDQLARALEAYRAKGDRLDAVEAVDYLNGIVAPRVARELSKMCKEANMPFDQDDFLNRLTIDTYQGEDGVEGAIASREDSSIIIALNSKASYPKSSLVTYGAHEIGVHAFQEYLIITGRVHPTGVEERTKMLPVEGPAIFDGDISKLISDGDPKVAVEMAMRDLWRAARVVGDVGIHVDGWSGDEFEKFYREQALMTSGIAKYDRTKTQGEVGGNAMYALGGAMIRQVAEQHGLSFVDIMRYGKAAIPEVIHALAAAGITPKLAPNKFGMAPAVS